MLPVNSPWGIIFIEIVWSRFRIVYLLVRKNNYIEPCQELSDPMDILIRKIFISDPVGHPPAHGYKFIIKALSKRCENMLNIKKCASHYDKAACYYLH